MLRPTLDRISATHFLHNLGLGVAVLLASAACLPGLPDTPAVSTPVESPAGTPLRIGKTVRGDLTGVITFTGPVQAKGRIAIAPTITARLEKMALVPGQLVRAGETLAELNRSDLEVRVLQAEADHAEAEAKLAELKAGPRPEAVAQAEANLKAAQARVEALTARASTENTEALQKAVDEARARLQQVQAPAPTGGTSSVAQAEAAVTAARNELHEILADKERSVDPTAVNAAADKLQRAQDAAASARAAAAPHPQVVAQAERALQEAEQRLAESQLPLKTFEVDQAQAVADGLDAQLKLVSAPATPEQVKLAEVAVQQAFAAAEAARRELNATVITAPIDAIVVDVLAEPGATVGPGATLVTLMPPEMQVVVQADEAQAAALKVGQSAAISVESYPRDVFSGKVKAIAPILDTRTRLVAVNVEVADPQGKLRSGMFTQLAIQTEQHKGAILVPREAVMRLTSPDGISPGQNAVFQVVDSRLRRQRVVLGASDGKSFEVISGLSEGVDVVLNPSPDLVDGDSILKT